MDRIKRLVKIVVCGIPIKFATALDRKIVNQSESSDLILLPISLGECQIKEKKSFKINIPDKIEPTMVDLYPSRMVNKLNAFSPDVIVDYNKSAKIMKERLEFYAKKGWSVIAEDCFDSNESFEKFKLKINKKIKSFHGVIFLIPKLKEINSNEMLEFIRAVASISNQDEEEKGFRRINSMS